MNNVLITLDIDWAPDFMINKVADVLIDYQVKATWLITHQSHAISCLKEYPNLFELGIHPNFLPNSTQGKHPKEILDFCLDIVPDAQIFRTHGLVQSSPLLAQIMEQTNLEIDLSLFLPYCHHISPLDYWFNKKRLIRIPYFWEDDFEMERPEPCWQFAEFYTDEPGLKIFNFHPIHIYLNSCNMDSYNQLKRDHYLLSDLTPDTVSPYTQTPEGTRTLFGRLVQYLKQTESSMHIKELI